MTVNVTQSHIDRGCEGDSTGCAVALAIQEQCPQIKFAFLETDKLYIGESGEMLKIPIPGPVQEWIKQFDDCEKRDYAGNPLQSFSFELELP
jgi:hypothetical protein